MTDPSEARDHSAAYAEFQDLIRRQIAAGDYRAAAHNLRVLADVADGWDITEMDPGEVADVATTIAELRAAADGIEAKAGPVP